MEEKDGQRHLEIWLSGKIDNGRWHQLRLTMGVGISYSGGMVGRKASFGVVPEENKR